MKPRRLISALLASLALSVGSYAADTPSVTLRRMEEVRDKAIARETGGYYYSAYTSLTEYASLAAELAEQGLVSPAEASIAAGYAEYLRFEPKLYLADSTGDGIAVGSDGMYVSGSSAVKFTIPFELADARDFFSPIPSSSEETYILAELDVKSEKALRRIAFGMAEDYLIRNLRQLSTLEGKVCLSFCPSVATLRRTRTVADSYKLAFAHVAELADRYAPNVSMVFSLEDSRTPSEQTELLFYPEARYVDILGIELCHTEIYDDLTHAEAAYRCRGECYDPVLSVKRLAEDFIRATGRDDIPVIITGCSFPWDGKAALDNWAEEAERFYRLIPAACPNLEAVFYSNASSSMGICNLRQSSEAAEVYRQCISSPWYDLRLRDDVSLSPTTEITYIPIGEEVQAVLYLGGLFRDAEYTLCLDGSEVSSGAPIFGAGEHTLTVYITDERCIARLDYALSISESGAASVTASVGVHDINRNGITDFGDVETITTYIAGWSDNTADAQSLDINGDGRVSLADVTALCKIISPN